MRPFGLLSGGGVRFGTDKIDWSGRLGTLPNLLRPFFARAAAGALITGLAYDFVARAEAGHIEFGPAGTLAAGVLLTLACAAYGALRQVGLVRAQGIIDEQMMELRQANAALRAEVDKRMRAESRLRDAIESISDGFVLYDADDKVALYNEKYRALRAYDPAIKPGQDFSEIVRAAVHRGEIVLPPEEAERWVEDRMRQHGNPVGPLIMRIGDRWIRVSERKTGEGGVVSILSDITELKTAERELARQTAVLSNLVENLPWGVGLLDRDLRLMAFNKSFLEMRGVPAGLAHVGASWEELLRHMIARGEFGPGDPDAILRERMTIAMVRQRMQFERVRPNGQVLDVSHIPLPDGGCVAVFIDVTERRRMERLLAESQKMEAVGRLTGGLAHDFNNLLGIVIGNLDQQIDLLQHLPDRPAVATDVRHLAADALDAALRGADVVRHLVSFSRGQPLEPKRLDAGEVVRGLAPLLRRALGERIAVETVTGDAAWPAAAALELARGVYVTVTVADTGTGIAPEILPRVFEPFFTTKEVGKGSGLGLSTVYGYARQSGGTVRISSGLGHGTRVQIYLPGARDDAEHARPGRGDRDTSQWHGEESILVVEDNYEVRQMALRLLGDFGYVTLEAETAADALALVDAGAHVDLLFTDVVMPGPINGVELARELRRRRPQVPIVLASGFSDPEALAAEARALRAGVIAKPFRKSDVAACIRAALDRASAEAKVRA